MKKPIIIGAILVVVVGIGIYLAVQDHKLEKLKVTDTNTNNSNNSTANSNAETKSSEQGEEFANLGQKHINPGEPHDPYNSNPPTSGPHWYQPADWGIYNKPLVDEQAVHNLEHGGIWISYKNIDADTKTKLEAIAKANPGSVIMSPRDADDTNIALASWTRLEKLDSYDEGKILDFIKANKNKSPEPISQ